MSVTRVLIANRGEIAIRVARACREHGIESVAVYSDADRGAPHVAAADFAEHIGPTPARDSYLNIEAVIAAAQRAGADAVHPGYGFLSENPEFVDACEAAGLTFIGPRAAAMRASGDKASAKRLAAEANVPTIPQWAADAVPADAFPVLVKASAGGGGRGMRIVERAADLPGALESAGREAAAGFGDDTLIIEKLVRGARHVEVQLLADEHGTCLYIGDRDCSLQRRHQKVIEEAPAPAPGLSDELRHAMGSAAVRIAVAAGYSGAGTAEFLVDDESGEFWFLELNARLQVEHPVTEIAFNIDLVNWQLRIARGEELTLRQPDITPVACAIEARLYAEDPVSLLPTGGRIAAVHVPSGADVRVDHAIADGVEVSLAYDPMLGKVIGSGTTREAARLQLLRALADTFIAGVVTNGALLTHALQLPEFVAARHHIGTLSAHALTEDALVPDRELVAGARLHLRADRGLGDPFVSLASWRVTTAAAPAASPDTVHMPAFAMVVGDRIWFSSAGVTYDIPRSTVRRHNAAGSLAGDGHADHAHLTAPMPGTVLSVLDEGSIVRRGEAVVVLEAMKMENAITAPFDGVVATVSCSAGDMVARGATVAELTRAEATAEVSS